MLNLNLADIVVLVGKYRVEELRMFDGEKQEGEGAVGQLLQRIFREPDGIGQTDDN